MYNLSVKTSNWIFAGTDENVGIQLVGTLGEGPMKFYDGDIGERFERTE